MRHLLFLSILLASFTVHAQAPITGVVIYPGSATVERTAQIAPGMTRLEVRGIPDNYNPDTLRVQTDSGIQVGQIVTREAAQSESVNPHEAELVGKLEQLRDQVTALDAELKAAGLVQSFLERLGTPASENAQLHVDGKSVESMVNTVRTESSAVFAKMQRLNIQKRELNKKIEAAESDLQKRLSGHKAVRVITVHLNAERAGTLKLSYQVNNAGWKPAYRAELNSAASTVTLERLATVSQKGGEDWQGVQMRLSTGQPRLSPQAPDPRPWLLSYVKPSEQSVPYAAAAAPMERRSELQYKLAEPNDYVAPVIETQGAFATEFEVPGRTNLPADGREVSVSLSKQQFAVKQRVRVVPRMEKAGVVTAEAERPEGVWLTGDIQLLRDGSYVGATRWNTQGNESFVFSFGRDDLIRVTVEPAKIQSGSGGFLETRYERRVGDLYTITSFHKTPINVLVLEASPVSASDEIKVESQYDPQPHVARWEERQGVIGWERTLAPKETLKIKTDYLINYPKRGHVQGLP